MSESFIYFSELVACSGNNQLTKFLKDYFNEFNSYFLIPMHFLMNFCTRMRPQNDWVSMSFFFSFQFLTFFFLHQQHGSWCSSYIALWRYIFVPCWQEESKWKTSVCQIQPLHFIFGLTDIIKSSYNINFCYVWIFFKLMA